MKIFSLEIYYMKIVDVKKVNLRQCIYTHTAPNYCVENNYYKGIKEYKVSRKF